MLAALSINGVLSVFSQTHNNAVQAYAQLVSEGTGQTSPWGQLRNQIFWGSESFVTDMLGRVVADAPLQDVPAAQRRAVPPALTQLAASGPRDVAIRLAYASGGYSM